MIPGPYVASFRPPRAVTLALNDTLMRNVVGVSRYGQYAQSLRQPAAFQDGKEMSYAFAASVKKTQVLHKNFGNNYGQLIEQEKWWYMTVLNAFRIVGRKFLVQQGKLTAKETAEVRVLENGTEEFESLEAKEAREGAMIDSELLGAGFKDVFRNVLHDLYEPSHWHIFPDVVGALERIRARGITVGLVSNFDDKLEDIVHGASSSDGSIAHLLDFVIGSRKYGVMKPHQGIFRHALELADVSPEELLHVGTHPDNDFRAPGVLGMSSLLMYRKPSTVALNTLLLNLQTDRVVHDMADVADVVDRLYEDSV